MSLLFQILVTAPPLLVAVILHEVAHGYVAERLGDPTARQLGRITFNPLKHIDPVLTILIPALLIIGGSPVIFGGAKPVPVDPRYFKNPRRGMAYVAIAGPITNFLLATLFYGIYLLFYAVAPNLELTSTTGSYIAYVSLLWILYSILVNLSLGLFNLLPVPPLDGGRIAVGFLPLELARRVAKLERWGFPIVIALIYFGVVDKVLGPVTRLVTEHLLR